MLLPVALPAFADVGCTTRQYFPATDAAAVEAFDALRAAASRDDGAAVAGVAACGAGAAVLPEGGGAGGSRGGGGKEANPRAGFCRERPGAEECAFNPQNGASQV